MHKKLEADLMSLAHAILQMKNKEDVFALKEKAEKLYEKLSILAFVEEYVNTTPNLEQDKAEIEAVITEAIQKKDEKVEVKEEKPSTIVYDLEEELAENELIEDELIDDELIEDTVEEIIVEDQKLVESQTIETLFFDEPQTTLSFKNDVKDVAERKTVTLEDELKDTVSVDITADLFDSKPKSVNDKLAKGIQIGLNDRIAFVKNLFNNNQEDYNRVISQLNSFKTEDEALKFIKRTVKPDYDWSAQEELETRFLGFIQNKFS